MSSKYTLTKDDLPVNRKPVLKRTDSHREKVRNESEGLKKKKKKPKYSAETKARLRAEMKERNRNKGGTGPGYERGKKFCTMILRDVNRKVRQNFHAWCKLNGTFMNAALEDFMRKCGNSIAVGEQHVPRRETKRGHAYVGKGKKNRSFRPEPDGINKIIGKL